jgi:hypothetical protein
MVRFVQVLVPELGIVTLCPLFIVTLSPCAGTTPPTHVEELVQEPDWAEIISAATVIEGTENIRHRASSLRKIPIMFVKTRSRCRPAKRPGKIFLVISIFSA